MEIERKIPYVIGLTGNIATGKSTVLNYLAEKGAHVIDADKVAHKTMMPDGAAYEKVIAAFGPSILDDNGAIDREALGAIVFGDPNALARLEAIVHPATFELARWDMAQSGADVIVLEAIKLLESGRIITLCDTTWVVTSQPDTQVQRLVEQRGMSEANARHRMNAQSSQAEKVAKADRVIENDGSRADLFAQLDLLWEEVMAARQPAAVEG